MSSLTTTLSASHARKNFYRLLKEVNTKLKRFTITRHGKTQAVVMSPEEVESWEETMEIMADKKLMKDLVQSEKERKQGKVYTHKQVLKELGISQKDLKSP